MDPHNYKVPATSEMEHSTHKRHHARPLKWIQSPVDHEEHVPIAGSGKFDQIPVPLGPNTAYQSLSDNEHQQWYPTKTQPVFKRHGESTPLELFYDLFFVANLTAFTSAHEINSGENLRSYIGFFSLLWFTWFNVSLYDLRLAGDSVFDRVCKAIQFGLMVGFVGVGAEFTPNKSGTFESGQAMGLLLAGSRFVLTAQYTVSFLFLRRYKGALPPMLMTIATTFVAGLAYVASSFAFPPFTEDVPKAYVAWYIICGIETGLTLLASIIWRILSFKGTHIVERMSLLTLIILGEGIIGMAEAIHAVLEHDLNGHEGATTASFRGAVVAAIILLYFLYMLYFDNIPEEHFGTIRSQIWAWFHYPLHVCLVLFVEGSAQALKWRRISGQMDILEQKWKENELVSHTIYAETDNNNLTATADGIGKFLDSKNTTDDGDKYFTDQAQAIGDVFSDLIEGTGLSNIGSLNKAIDGLEAIADGAFIDKLKLINSIFVVYITSATSLLEAFGASPPEDESAAHDANKIRFSINSTSDSSPERRGLFRRSEAVSSNATSPELTEFENLYKEYEEIPKLFRFTFQYYYITGGMALISLGLLTMLGKKSRWTKWDWFLFISFFVFGAILALLSVTSLFEATLYLSQSPMVVPLAMIIVGLPVVIKHI